MSDARHHLRTIPLGIAFEAGLGGIGLALAWSLSIPIAARLNLSADVATRCVLGLLPMLMLLAAAMGARRGPLARLRRQVQDLAGELFGQATWMQLVALAAAAGVGEELLFRGALQPLAGRWLGPVEGLVAVSLLFGMMHAATITYAAVAALIGLYLGWLAQTYDDLVAPIVIHAVYDWIALIVLVGPRRRRRVKSDA